MDNFTLQISGRNILPFIKLNITSLLYYYPEIKNNIVVFDDNSTDGTREWLEDQNISVISWKYFNYDDINQLYDPYQSNGSIYRISCILEEIFGQQTTDKLIIMDGDQFIIKKGIIEKQIYSLTHNQDVFQVKNSYNYVEQKTASQSVEQLELYKRFIEKFPNFTLTKVNETTIESILKVLNLNINDISIINFDRIHPYFLQVNLNKMKDNNIYFDNAYENKYFLLNKLDTGILFLENLKQNNISIEYQNDIINNFVFHFIWTSSIKLIYDNSTKNSIVNAQHKKHMMVNYKDKIEPVLQELDFDASKIYDEIKNWANDILLKMEGEKNNEYIIE